MGVLTSFLKLLKPSETENFNEQRDQNGNWDKIDANARKQSGQIDNLSNVEIVSEENFDVSSVTGTHNFATSHNSSDWVVAGLMARGSTVGNAPVLKIISFSRFNLQVQLIQQGDSTGSTSVKVVFVRKKLI